MAINSVGGLDSNSRRALFAESNANDGTLVNLWADPTTHRLLVDSPGLAGTKVYYVSDTSGGAVTRKLTFKNGLLISET